LSSTSDLVATLVGRSNFSSIYIIANFQDLDSTYQETVKEKLKFKTYGFSAIELDSKEKFLTILKNIISISYPTMRKSSDAVQSIPNREEILYEIERAIENSTKEYNSAAIQMFSSLTSLLEKPITDMDSTESKILMNICKAWELIVSWEIEKDTIYLKRAIESFESTLEYIEEKPLHGLISANSIFCEALILAMEYDESFDQNKRDQYIPHIKSLLAKSLSIYEKFGYENERAWTMQVIESLDNV